MNADGKCLCGQIQFEADIDSTTTTICQRTDCQINSGTTFGYVVGAVNNIFKLLKGKLSFYNNIVEIGAKRELAFCGVFGTRIDARPVEGKLVFFWLRFDLLDKEEYNHPAASMEETLIRLGRINLNRTDI